MVSWRFLLCESETPAIHSERRKRKRRLERLRAEMDSYQRKDKQALGPWHSENRGQLLLGDLLAWVTVFPFISAPYFSIDVSGLTIKLTYRALCLFSFVGGKKWDFILFSSKSEKRTAPISIRGCAVDINNCRQTLRAQSSSWRHGHRKGAGAQVARQVSAMDHRVSL